MNNILLTCPHCGKEIQATQAIAQTLANEKDLLYKEAEKEALVKFKNIHKQEIESKQAADMQQLQVKLDLSQKSQLQQNKKISELLDKLHVSEEAQRSSENEMKEKLTQREDEIYQKLKKDLGEAHQLKIAEKDKKIADLVKSANEAALKGGMQSTGQLQGEVLELSSEEKLRKEFPDDLIREVPKGFRGADFEQVVRNHRGADCGVILWESKQAKRWQNAWIDKLKEDTLRVKARISAMVSTILPQESPSGILLYQGVWIARPYAVITLSTLLRGQLLKVHQVSITNKYREKNSEALYNYINGHEFAQRIQDSVDIINNSQDNILKERRAFEKIWAQREKEAQRLARNTISIIGDMEGIIGAESMSKIKNLGLSSLADKKNLLEDKDNTPTEAKNSQDIDIAPLKKD